MTYSLEEDDVESGPMLSHAMLDHGICHFLWGKRTREAHLDAQ